MDTIIYIEALKNYIRIRTSQNTILVMKDILYRLPAKNFMRIHRSYIVSLKHAKLVENSHIQLQNADRLPVGETYRKAVGD